MRLEVNDVDSALHLASAPTVSCRRGAHTICALAVQGPPRGVPAGSQAYGAADAKAFQRAAAAEEAQEEDALLSEVTSLKTCAFLAPLS